MVKNIYKMTGLHVKNKINDTAVNAFPHGIFILGPIGLTSSNPTPKLGSFQKFTCISNFPCPEDSKT